MSKSIREKTSVCLENDAQGSPLDRRLMTLCGAWDSRPVLLRIDERKCPRKLQPAQVFPVTNLSPVFCLPAGMTILTRLTTVLAT